MVRQHAVQAPGLPPVLCATDSCRLERTALSRSTLLDGMESTERMAASVALVAVAVKARMQRVLTRLCSTAPSLHSSARAPEDDCARAVGTCPATAAGGTEVGTCLKYAGLNE